MNLSERAMKIIRLIYGITVTLMLLLTAVLFTSAARGINALGASPYTYASIGAAFGKIAVPVYLTLATVVAGGIFFTFFMPDGKRRLLPPKDYEAQLRRAYRFADMTAASPDLKKKIRLEHIIRKGLLIANCTYFALGVLLTLLGAINPETYAEGVSSQELTSSVLRVVYAALIFIAPAALMACLRIAVNAISAEYELNLVKKLPKRKPTADTSAECVYKKRIRLGIRLAVLAVGAVFVILGVLNGGMQSVLEKAVKICTECIGLG